MMDKQAKAAYEREFKQSKDFWFSYIENEAKSSIEALNYLAYMRDESHCNFLEDYKNLLWAKESEYVMSVDIPKNIVEKTTPLILASGNSSRFGIAKPLIPLLGNTMVYNTVGSLVANGFKQGDIHLLSSFGIGSYLQEMSLYMHNHLPNVNVSFRDGEHGSTVVDCIHMFSRGLSVEYLYNKEEGWEEEIVKIPDPKENILVIPGDIAMQPSGVRRLVQGSRGYSERQECVASVLKAVPTTFPETLSPIDYRHRKIGQRNDLARNTAMFMLKRDYVRKLDIPTEDKVWERTPTDSRDTDPEYQKINTERKEFRKLADKRTWNYLIRLMTEDGEGRYATVINTDIRAGNLNTSREYYDYIKEFHEMMRIRTKDPNINVVRAKPRRYKDYTFKPGYLYRPTPLDYYITGRWLMTPLVVFKDSEEDKNPKCGRCQLRREDSNENLPGKSISFGMGNTSISGPDVNEPKKKSP